MSELTEAEVVRDLTRQTESSQRIMLDDGRQYILFSSHQCLQDVSDAYGLPTAPPHRIKKNVTLLAKDALVGYLQRFRNDNTILFGDVTKNQFTGAIDYHGPNAPDYALHRATLALKLSVEWEAWTAIDGKMLGQLEFARFIEENMTDIVAPEAADILEAVRDLHAHRKVNFIKAVRTSSDNENFEFSDDVELKHKSGTVEVPTRFRLSIPVYYDEPGVEAHAFLRWRLEDGQLKLGVKLHRWEHVRQAVFKQIMVDIAERAQVIALLGVD